MGRAIVGYNTRITTDRVNQYILISRTTLEEAFNAALHQRDSKAVTKLRLKPKKQGESSPMDRVVIGDW